MKIGDLVEGRVTGIKPYGIFVQLLKSDQVGLIHISEVKSGYVADIRDSIRINQRLLAQVIDIDEFTQKISLSLRSLEKKSQPLRYRHRFSNHRYQTGFTPLAKQLPIWIEDGMTALKKRKDMD